MFERRVKPGLRKISKISKISMVSLFLWVMMAGILLVTQAFAQTNFTVEPYHPNGKKYAGQSGIGDISGSTILAANTRGNEYSVNISLDGVTEYELAEIFGKVIDNSAGVLETRRISSRIIPDNPQACYVLWRVRIENTDANRLQNNIMNTIRQIIGAGGNVMLRGVSYRYTASEVNLLKRIRPGKIINSDIQFVTNR